MSRPYTFNPPEEELINHYLNNTIKGNYYLVENEINVISICQHEPLNLPGLAKIGSKHTWYFVSRVEKLGKSNKTKRATRTGHWKITGKSCVVKDNAEIPIGFKKFLVFQENKGPSSSSSSSSTTLLHKSTWVIHEFHSFLQHPNKDAFVLCKLIKKGGSGCSVAANASPIATAPSLNVSSLCNPQPQVTGEVLRPRLSDEGVYDHNYNLEEFLSEVHNPNWITGDYYSSLLLLSQSHHLQCHCFAHTIPAWNGEAPISQSESLINPNYQIQETGDFASGSHVYGQNNEYSEVVGGDESMAPGTVSNDQIQDQNTWIWGPHSSGELDTWQYLIPRSSQDNDR